MSDTIKTTYNIILLCNKSVFNMELRETCLAALLYKVAKADFIVFIDFDIIYIITQYKKSMYRRMIIPKYYTRPIPYKTI